MAESDKKRLCPDHAKKPSIINRKRICPNEIRRALLNDVKEPIVFHDYLLLDESVSQCSKSYWNCISWDASMFGALFGDKLLHFRLGPRVGGDEVLALPQWESACLKATLTFGEFVEWSKGQRSCLTTSGQEVHSNSYWAYFDYFYMRELKDNVLLQGVIDWSLFGFPGRGIEESTLWIGSSGANTPCHIDTYGSNLVAQVLGKKRWVMFPKTQAPYLSPTRIPYEESSIYSKVGFPRPCLITHPDICSATPYVVTLEPGDVLYVPNHWWHFVENLEFSVSINTWIELPTDDQERVKEAFVMYQVGSLCQGVESVDYISSIFNPNMLEVAAQTSTDLLELLTSKVLKRPDNIVDDAVRCRTRDDAELTENNSVSRQKMHSDNAGSSLESGHHLYTLNWNNVSWCTDHGIEKVPQMLYDMYIKSVLSSDFKLEYEKSLKLLKTEKVVMTPHRQDNNLDNSRVTLPDLEILVDTLADYRVIDVIKKVFDEKLRNSNGRFSCN